MSDELQKLREIVARLRAPGGCPWDREQTHRSLRGCMIEEAYEVVDAIDRNADQDLREELGDFLLQVFMHAQIAEEEGRFTLDDIAQTISEKLIRRHPHVFGDASAHDSEAVLKQWDAIKRKEKGTPADASRLDGVTASLPALLRSAAIHKKASKAGFDWDDAKGVLGKVREELDELEAEMAAGNAIEIEKEVGDLLFSVVNLSRKLKVDPELALTASTLKFIRRFQQMEKIFAESGKRLEESTLAEMDAVWDAIKRQEKGSADPTGTSNTPSASR